LARINVLISEIEKNNCKVGIAICLDNTIEDIKPLLHKVDLITIMSIKPGFGGQKFEDAA
ncbi:ribulose-phosphate 3-epimerase, partial [Rhizobium sp. KAs_5_22]